VSDTAVQARAVRESSTEGDAWSIERKLPLLIGVLLALALGAVTLASWLEMRRTAQRAAAERLGNVAGQFADLFRQSVAVQRQRFAVVPLHPALATLARDTSARARGAALQALEGLNTRALQPDQIVATEVRDARGRVVVATRHEEVLARLPLREIIPPTENTDSASVGAFALLRDTMVYPIAAKIQGATDVYVVRWRRMIGSRRQREQLAQLVGSDASIFLGNAQGAEWHDLERPVTRPGFADVPEPRDSSPREFQRDGATHYAMVRPVPGTPWQVAVDFPAAGVIAPVNAFLRRMAIIAALALLVGLVATWVLSRQITRPLVELTHAAEGMAAGLYGQQVHLRTNDELGRLAQSFSSMSAEVQRTRDDLESQVQLRTRELRDAQDTIVRRERLAMLGQLSSGVGHELRNPLGVMTNSVYFLKVVLKESPPKVHEYLDIIGQQIALSEKIVSDLLDFARQKPPLRKPTPLRPLVEAQIDRLGRRDGVRIEMRIPPDLPDVLVDPVQLGQVVFNLLTNAVQAMDGAGRVDVIATSTAGRVRFVVRDTGPGIPAENLEKVFEPLFTTKARGIGLGLAVSRTIARANGGDLTVTSTPGEGAVFTLSLDAVSHLDSRMAGDRAVAGGVT
jgi:signal transduction histidine kinase